mmetsp:Transcript_54583/g.90934  ORF Transcript_54583/g.90934 Transcript_54583/m.90934 type:complete len:433 (-) Transcript_54583:1945-3243(-)
MVGGQQRGAGVGYPLPNGAARNAAGRGLQCGAAGGAVGDESSGDVGVPDCQAGAAAAVPRQHHQLPGAHRQGAHHQELDDRRREGVLRPVVLPRQHVHLRRGQREPQEDPGAHHAGVRVRPRAARGARLRQPRGLQRHQLQHAAGHPRRPAGLRAPAVRQVPGGRARRPPHAAAAATHAGGLGAADRAGRGPSGAQGAPSRPRPQERHRAGAGAVRLVRAPAQLLLFPRVAVPHASDVAGLLAGPEAAAAGPPRVDGLGLPHAALHLRGLGLPHPDHPPGRRPHLRDGVRGGGPGAGLPALAVERGAAEGHTGAEADVHPWAESRGAGLSAGDLRPDVPRGQGPEDRGCLLRYDHHVSAGFLQAAVGVLWYPERSNAVGGPPGAPDSGRGQCPHQVPLGTAADPWELQQQVRVVCILHRPAILRVRRSAERR